MGSSSLTCRNGAAAASSHRAILLWRLALDQQTITDFVNKTPIDKTATSHARESEISAAKHFDLICLARTGAAQEHNVL